MAARRQTEAWHYRPALDGLRTVAVYLVVLFHSGLAVARGGFIGVDLFFVLSGFLITNVLLHDIDVNGRIQFGRFYARRARRLLLPAVVVIVVTSVAFLLIASTVDRLPLVGDARSALLYVANWRFLSESNNYFATGFAKSPFLHFWSLGIEEQFYVVYPLLITALVWLGRRRPWLLATGLATLLAASLGAQLHFAHLDPNHAYYGTDTRAYQLLAGGLLAVALRARHLTLTRRGVSSADAAALVALVGMLLLGSNAFDVGSSGRGVAAAAASVVLIGGVTLGEGGRLSTFLARPRMVYLGGISYATYLWHWPIIVVVRDLYHVTPVELALLSASAATALAALSSVVLERPVRRSRRLDDFRWPTVAAGLTLSVVVAVAVVPPVLDHASRPVVTTALSAPAHSVPPARVPTAHRASFRTLSRAKVPNLNWQSFVNDNGPARTCNAAAPLNCEVVRGGRPNIVVVGDSHARMIVPVLTELARAHGFSLYVNAMSSCPWQADLTNLVLNPSGQAMCTAARATWYRQVLPKLHPDLVIVASYARDNEAIYGHSLLRTSGPSEPLHQLIKDTTKATLAQITRTGARALILDSIITSTFDPLSCLSSAKYVRQCIVPVPHPPISDTYYNAAAAHSANVFTFSLNQIACPTAPACLPILDGIPVWRNVNHYTIELLSHFRAQVWNDIRSTGALKGLP